jgi:hypothetical protein
MGSLTPGNPSSNQGRIERILKFDRGDAWSVEEAPRARVQAYRSPVIQKDLTRV